MLITKRLDEAIFKNNNSYVFGRNTTDYYHHYNNNVHTCNILRVRVTTYKPGVMETPLNNINYRLFTAKKLINVFFSISISLYHSITRIHNNDSHNADTHMRRWYKVCQCVNNKVNDGLHL